MSRIFALLILLASMTTCGAVCAAMLRPGDIVVADGDGARVILIDPTTGAQTLLSSGGMLVRPLGIAIDAHSRILVVDEDASNGAVIQIDPITGKQTLISAGPNSQPSGISVDSSGNLYVSEQLSNRVVKISGTDGSVLAGYDAGLFNKPMLSAFDADGDLIVPNRGNSTIVKLNVTTGQQTLLTGGGLLGSTHSVAVEATGTILIAGGQRIVRLDPANGVQQLLTSGNLFAGSLTGIALESTGAIVVADRDTGRLISPSYSPCRFKSVKNIA